MISKSEIKLIRSLQQKKFRKETGLFIAEGDKTARELADSDIHIEKIFARSEWRARNIHIASKEVSEKEMGQISALSTPSEVLVLARIPEQTPHWGNEKVVLMLDSIRDPGNLVTIARIADWYGLSRIFCSEDCADFYAPKTVQSTMGSIAHVRAIYGNPIEMIRQINLPVYAAMLEGAVDIHSLTKAEPCVLLIGNEGRGISPELQKIASKRIFIPGYGKAESLNAAIATGIILDNLTRLHKI
jgi:TrmH family RNA methyltransferase